MSEIEYYVSVLESPGRAQAGSVVYPPGGTYGPRLQPNYQLLLLHTGELEVTFDGSAHRLDAGNVALLKPGHEEFFRFAVDRETHHTWLALHRPPLPPALVAALDGAPFSLPLSAPLERLMGAALAVRDDLASPQPALVPLVAAALAVYLAEAETAGYDPDHPTGSGGRSHPAVAAARTLIRRGLSQRLGLAELAAAGNVTPEHLVRLFRRDLGTTPIAYLWQERVRHGIFLLEHTGLSVAQVAERAGFLTSFHFSRLVRAATGLPPREIQRRRSRPTRLAQLHPGREAGPT